MTVPRQSHNHTTNTPRIALVGHCVPDAYMLKSAVERFAPGASVVSVNQTADLQRELDAADVLLVNRVLDGYFEHSTGVALIRSIIRDASTAPTAVLISNRDDAQAEALAAGAMPGFGKSELYEDSTRERLTAAIERSASRHRS